MVAGRRPDDPPRRRGRALSTYTGLTISGNSGTGDTIQRLYPLTDAQGSIVAVASPTGVVQERYTYDVNGLPQSLNTNFTAYMSSGVPQYGSALGWNWFHEVSSGSRPSRTRVLSQWRGLYVSAAGVWSDPVHGRALQPNLSAYGDPQTNPYQMSTYEKFGARSHRCSWASGPRPLWGSRAGPPCRCLGLLPQAAALRWRDRSSPGLRRARGRGNDDGCRQLRREQQRHRRSPPTRLIGGVAGALGGAAGSVVGAGAGLLVQGMGLGCGSGSEVAGGALMGAAEGGAFGAMEGFSRGNDDDVDRRGGGPADGRLAGRPHGCRHRRPAGGDIP